MSRNKPSLLILGLSLLYCLMSVTVYAQRLDTSTLPRQEAIALQGQITDFVVRSPNSSLSILVSDGNVTNTWAIEAPSANELRRLGWSNNSLFQGEIARLMARPIVGRPFEAELVSVTRANGALLLAGAQNSSGTLDVRSMPSGLYQLDADHAYLTFSYNHRGFSNPQLRFDRFSASLNFDNQNPELSEVLVEIDVSSLNSGVSELDRELRSDTFFDSLNHPRISFRSQQIEMDAWGHAEIRGEITIKGQAKNVVLEAQINGAGFNQQNSMHTLGVSLTGKLNRSDWGMNRFIPQVSNEIEIRVEAEFVQPEQALKPN